MVFFIIVSDCGDFAGIHESTVEDRERIITKITRAIPNFGKIS